MNCNFLEGPSQIMCFNSNGKCVVNLADFINSVDQFGTKYNCPVFLSVGVKRSVCVRCAETLLCPW